MPFAKIDTNTSGANTIVAAKAGQKIQLLSGVLVGAGAVTVKWQSHVAPTDLSGAMSLATGTPLVYPASPMAVAAPRAYLETLVGEALDLNLGGGVQVSGHIEYRYTAV